MKYAIGILIALLLIGGASFFLLSRPAPGLTMYAGAGLRKGVEKLEARFEEKTGIPLEVDYGGSGIIISRARHADELDLFMPGDVHYVDRLHELTGRVTSKTTVSWFVPVIIVQKGNPRQIKGLEDFSREDVTVGLGKPDACQVGRLCKKMFSNLGMDAETVADKQSVTVNELGLWVKTGSVDTAVVWDAIAQNFTDSVDTVIIPKEKNILSHVVVGLLSTSRNPADAQKFIDFMTSEEGKTILREAGYTVEEPYK